MNVALVRCRNGTGPTETAGPGWRGANDEVSEADCRLSPRQAHRALYAAQPPHANCSAAVGPVAYFFLGGASCTVVFGCVAAYRGVTNCPETAERKLPPPDLLPLAAMSDISVSQVEGEEPLAPGQSGCRNQRMPPIQ